MGEKVRDYSNFYGKGNPNYNTGLACVGKRKSLYNSWCNMKQRCLNPNHPKYGRYGGRGVKICEEWLSIKNFMKWAIDSGWKDGLSIDRIDNNGDYIPSNCRFISISENSRKKRTTKISFEDAKIIRERIELGENPYKLAEEYGVVHGTIWFIQHKFTHVKDGECTKAINRRKKDKS